MQPIFQVKNWRTLLNPLILSLLCLTAIAGAHADTSNDNVFDIQVRLTNAPIISLGEPVFLHYKITNLSDGKVGVQMEDNTTWYTLALVDSAGHSIPMGPHLLPVEKGGFRGVKNGFMNVGGSDQGDIVVTQRFAISQPGKYKLVMHIHLPYATADATAEGSSNDLVAKSGAMLIQDYALPFTIVPADAVRLNQVSEYLYHQLLSKKYGPEYDALLDALFSMPEAQASESWAKLANQASWIDAESIAASLARVHSIKTIDLLVRLLDNPKLSDEAVFIKTKIDESYNAGDATVKGHIKAIATSRGAEMPAKVPIPIPSD